MMMVRSSVFFHRSRVEDKTINITTPMKSLKKAVRLYNFHIEN